MVYVTDLSGFIKELSKLTARHNGAQLLFRGHTNRKYKAEPSVLRRDDWRRREHEMLRELLAHHPAEFAKDSSTFDLLARAQHYGLPTRLLDITSNPLVALFFDCKDGGNVNASSSISEATSRGRRVRRSAGEVIIFLPNSLKRRFFDSESVSVLCNLSYMGFDAKSEIRDHLINSYQDAKLKYEDPEDFKRVFVKSFNDNAAVKELLGFVKRDNPGVGNSIEPRSLVDIVAVFPRRLDPRISAQSGAFLVFGLFSPESTDTETFLLDRFDTEEIYISPKDKPRILSELNGIGINNESLFPSLQETASKIKLGNII